MTAVTSPVRAARRRSSRTDRLLAVLVALTVGLAPIEGYLLRIGGWTTKVAPALLVVTWGLARVRARALPRLQAVSWCAAGLLVVVLASSAVNTGNPYLLSYLVRWLPFLVLAVVLVDLLSGEVDPRVALGATAAGAVVAGTGALVSFLFLGARRATGPLQDPNDLAYVLVSALPLILLLGAGARRPWLRRTCVGGAVVLVAGAALTFSRGGAIAAAVLLVWAAAQRLISLRSVAVGAVAAVLLAAGVYVLAGDLLTNALQEKAYIASTNVATRELRWGAAARELVASPVLGFGPGSARENYVAYAGNAELAEPTAVTHNMYLEIGAELGLLGLSAFLAAVVSALAATLRPAARDRTIALACQGSLLAVLTASTFLSEEYYMALWVAVATAGAIGVRARRGAR